MPDRRGEKGRMDKYIKREDAIAEFQELKNKCESLKDAIYFDGVMAVLDNIPAEDVALVRHGRWIVHFDHFAPYQKCSVCGFETPLVATENEAETCRYKHCPECAARMDKEADHD